MDDARPTRFVDLVRAELVRRSARNPRYSLRAFARFLDVDAATLSQLLRGQRSVTERSMRRLGLRLGLSERALAACLAAEAEAEALEAGLRRVEELLRDSAGLAAEWHHHAILAFAREDGFVADSRHVAEAVGVTVDEVNVALQRLARLGLLRMEGPRWVVLAKTAAHAQAVTLAALERCHESIGRLIAAAHRRTGG